MGTKAVFAIFSLAMLILSHPAWAGEAEHVYIGGEHGHFKLEEGKIYHFKWTGEALEKPAEAEGPPPMVKPAEAVRTAPASAEKRAPEAEPGDLARITREAIDRMIRDFEEAASRKDFDSVARYFAEDVIIFLTIETPQGTQNLRFDRDEYLAHVKQALSLFPYYEYRSENVTVNISEDGQSATASSDVHETMGNQEIKVSSVTRENFALELRDGRLQITKVVGKTKM